MKPNNSTERPKTEIPFIGLAKEPMDRLARRWGWFFALGVIFIILGGVALTSPFFASVGVLLAVSTLLLVTGFIHLFQSLWPWSGPGRWTHFLQSILALLAGWMMLRYPVLGLTGVTLVLTFYLIVTGVGRWLLASEMRPHEGWGWILFSAVVSLLLGIVLLAGFPISALWMPGTFVGVDLVFYGVSLTAVAFTLRSLKRKQGPPRRVEAA